MKKLLLKIINYLTPFIIGQPFIERLLIYSCSNPFLRSHFKLGVIPMSYISVLKQPEIRIARVGGFYVYVNVAEYSGISLFFFREYSEAFTALLISSLVEQDDVCIDAGANVGIYTFLMAHKVGGNGKIFAFEPQPYVYNLIAKSIELNLASNIICIDSRALYTKSNKMLKFYLSQNPNNLGTSSLINHGIFIDEDNYISVRTVSLADYFKENKINKCKLLKVDVERSEMEVLTGGLSLLVDNRIDYIVLEQFAGGNVQDLLQSIGYTCWLINDDEHFLVEIDQVNLDTFANYLFVNSTCVDAFKSKYSHIVN